MSYKKILNHNYEKVKRIYTKWGKILMDDVEDSKSWLVCDNMHEFLFTHNDPKKAGWS